MTDDEIIEDVLTEMIRPESRLLILQRYLRDDLKIKDNLKWREILDKLILENLAEFKGDESVVKITPHGREINKNGGWLKHVSLKNAQEEFEKRKAEIDFELAQKMLKDFPATKRRAQIASLIAIILFLYQICEWIWNAYNN